MNCIRPFQKMTILLLVLTLQVTVFSCTNVQSGKSAGDNDLVLVCGDSKVLLVDFSNQADTIPSIIWSWDAHEAQDLPPEYRDTRFNSIDDCKAVKNGKQLLVSSSRGAIALLNIEDKKVLFYAAVPNAHSIELLPGDLLAAAASTAEGGNSLKVLDVKHPGEVMFSDSLYSAHGVVWDETRNVLYALGYDVLREYRIKGRHELQLAAEWEIPGISGHDLQMAPDGNNLFLTEHTGAWVFIIGNKEFKKIEGFPDAEDIKSINQNKQGQFVFTVPEESWWTYHVSFHNPAASLAFPGMHVYKARWFNP